MLWIFITSQQRCLNDLCNGTVCLPGHASWIHFSQSLQKFWRRKVEIKCPSDFNAVSRHCICSFLCYEFGVVVSTSLNTSLKKYLYSKPGSKYTPCREISMHEKCGHSGLNSLYLKVMVLNH